MSTGGLLTGGACQFVDKSLFNLFYQKHLIVYRSLCREPYSVYSASAICQIYLHGRSAQSPRNLSTRHAVRQQELHWRTENDCLEPTSLGGCLSLTKEVIGNQKSRFVSCLFVFYVCCFCLVVSVVDVAVVFLIGNAYVLLVDVAICRVFIFFRV